MVHFKLGFLNSLEQIAVFKNVLGVPEAPMSSAAEVTLYAANSLYADNTFTDCLFCSFLENFRL
jgi:hypothetical protein